MNAIYVVRRQGPLTRTFVILATFGLLMVSARDVSAACQNGSSSQTVAWASSAAASGSNLHNVLSASSATCTITVTPGTYTAPFGTFVISSNITVRAQAGAPVILQSTSGGARAVAISPNGSSCPSGATLEGFTLEAPNGGVYVGTNGAGGCPSNLVTNVTLRKLIVNSGTTPTNGHGIVFDAVQNSVIDSCAIVKAYANGIFLALNSNNNIVMNNTCTGGDAARDRGADPATTT